MSSGFKNFDHKQVDPLIDNRVRLAILAAVAQSEEVDFMSLKHAVNTSDGNLSIQLRKLEEADFLAIRRSMQQSRQQTNMALTNKGYNALNAYKALMRDWLDI